MYQSQKFFQKLNLFKIFLITNLYKYFSQLNLKTKIHNIQHFLELVFDHMEAEF